MTVLDIFLAFLVVVATVLGAIRGFGIAVLDLLALYSALLFSGFLAPIIARSLPTVGPNSSGFAGLEILAFIVVSSLFLVVSRLSYNAIQWSAGMFDRFGGAITGAAAGIVFCHAIVAGLAVGDSQQASALSGGFSQQMLTFSSYHDMIDGLKAVITPPAILS